MKIRYKIRTGFRVGDYVFWKKAFKEARGLWYTDDLAFKRAYKIRLIDEKGITLEHDHWIKIYPDFRFEPKGLVLVHPKDINYQFC